MKNSRNILLLLAFILGLSIGDLAVYTKSALFPTIIILMALSFTGISSKEFFPLKSLLKPVLLACFLNYFFFGVLLLLWYKVFNVDPSYWSGFVVAVTTPPGVAIIPFAFLLKGDVKYATVGTVGAYIFALFISPIALQLLVGQTNVSIQIQLFYMLKVIALPFLISRFLRSEKLLPAIEKARGTVINICFFIVFFTILGMNRNVFFSDPGLILKLVLVAFFTYVVPGEILHRSLSSMNVAYEKIIVTRMLAGIKNGGLIAVTAFDLFGAKAAIPGTIISSVAIIYLLSLTIRYGED